MTDKTPNNGLAESVLLFQLQERYYSMHKLRERIQTISLRILGIILGTSGWLTQGDLKFSCLEKGIAINLLFICSVLFVLYFEMLKRGWLSQHRIASTLEKKLGLTEELLPKKFEDSNSWPFLNSHYRLLGFGVIVLLICILYFT